MNKHLATFSLLSTQWQKYNKSYLDNFVPLFATLLVEKQKRSFEHKDFTNLANDFKDLFSLHLPAYLVSPLVSKLIQLHLITKERNEFIFDSSKIIEHKLYIKDEIESYAHKQNLIFSDFIKYCKDKYQKQITQEDANRIILSFIKENDADIIFRDIKTDSSQEEFFLVAKYVSSLYIENPDLYRDIVNFAVGNIAFNAIYLAPIESNSESLKKCVFFLDSSFIFPLLGIDSMQREEIIKDILHEIHSKGGFVKIYQHTHDEIIEILKTAIKYVDSPMYNPKLANKALSFLRQEGFSATKVELILHSLDRILKENRIDTEKEIPDKKLCIDENALTVEIENNLSLRQYESANKCADRTERDVKSIIYTYEKRKKVDSENFVDAKYSFVTENALLTRADKKVVSVYSQKNTSEHDFFPAAIPEAMLCAYLYLGSANKVIENVTLSVLATAFTAIRPTAELENLIKDTALKLKENNRITENEYNLVISSHLIKDCLAERTLTSYENVNEDTIFALIEDAKDSIGLDERKKRKEAETKLFEEEIKNKQRKLKAKKRAKKRTLIVCCLKYFLLLIPYIFSAFSLFNMCWKITLSTFVIWTIFCFVLNHYKSISLKSIWQRTYYKSLKNAYAHFVLNMDELENNQ